MKRIRVITLGCSKNSVDTEHLLASLPADAFTVTDDAPYDYLLYNTCGFIGDAKEESINAIFEGVEAKKRGDVGKLVVFGCLSQRYSAQMPELIPEVDAWFGARDMNPILDYLGVPRSDFLGRVPGYNRGFAYLKISEGCDRRCSYCAIPYIRGAHKSVPIEDLVKEAKALAADGVHELLLIAQDTTYYGLDLYRRRRLADLIRALSEIEGIEWIRVHYSYPSDFPEDVLDEIASNPKACKYLDIPLQHISDRVLSNMHRHVDSATTRSLVRKMRERIPGVVLRTTMIVGHPGEGDDEFEELLSFIKEAGFERLGAFTYSEEEGTWGADNLRDDVPEDVKSHRLDELMGMQAEMSLQFNLGRVGTQERVMVDAVADGKLICRSQYESPDVDGEIVVEMKGTDGIPAIGSFIDVRITGADEYDLTAVEL